MRRVVLFLLFALSVIFLYSCEITDASDSAYREATDNQTVSASLERIETRTYLDEAHEMHWNADDRISVFTSTANDQYKFNGRTGDYSGTFSQVQPGQTPGYSVRMICGVYPYKESTALTTDGSLSLFLPEVQLFSYKSFAPGSNTMLAVSSSPSDMFLPFKNLCGFLVVRVYGEGVVENVLLEGNNGEHISGNAGINVYNSSDPVIEMGEDAGKSITIDCGNGIELGKTPETATEFWFVVPPVCFEKGFTIKVRGNGIMQSVFKTEVNRTLQRNVINRMTPVEALFDTVRDDNVKIPDPNFKQACVALFDEDGDGEVSYPEAIVADSLNVNHKGIHSIEGLKAFVNITFLDCSANEISEMDLSANSLLEVLICHNNKFSSYDFSVCPQLVFLDCSGNLFASLDLKGNALLQELHCQNNRNLSALDASVCPSLSLLWCYDSPVASLNLTGLSSLKALDCHNCCLEILDIVSCNTLEHLDCSCNTISTLEPSCPGSLKHLICFENRIANIDVSDYSSLETIVCYSNGMQSLDVKGCTSLSSLECYANELTALNLNDCRSMKNLQCHLNRIARIDASACTNLITLLCYGNRATVLKINSTELKRVECYLNSLRTLDCSNCSQLDTLICFDSNLATLKVNGTSLQYLDCGFNSLKELNLRGFTELTYLKCNNNQLSKLVLTDCRSLDYLVCGDNQLKELDLSSCFTLRDFTCWNNLLVTLDLSNCLNLYRANCSSNPKLSVIKLKQGQVITVFNFDQNVTIEYI